MAKCEKCNKELNSEDGSAFCNKCGKTIYESKEVGKLENRGWEEEVIILRCTTKKSTLRYNDLVNIPNVINPILIKEADDEERVYFKARDGYISLVDLLNRGVSYNEAIFICTGILDIFVEFEKNELILDEVAIDDFEVNEKDLGDVYYKCNRRFSKKDKLENNYSFKENIIVPDKQSKEGLSKESNVYLFGRLFVQILLNNKSFKSTEEERYFLYNLNMFREDIPYDFHEFIGRVTSLYVEDRYSSMEDVRKVFIYIVTKKERYKIEKEFELSAVGKSHVGNGKLARAIKKQLFAQDPEDYNEDIFYIDTFEDKKLIAVGDGVSTAIYGSGKEASRFLKKNIEAVWNASKVSIKEKEDFEILVKEVCDKTNVDILSKVKEDVLSKSEENFSGGIMASTLVIAFIDKNKMYYSSIGDSLIYLYNKKSGLALLNYENNMQNEWLKEGESLESVNGRENKAYISDYVGKIKYVNNELEVIEPRCMVRERVIETGDIVVLCSDGIMDYIIKPLEGSRNIWYKDNALVKVLSNEDLSLGEKCNLLIEIANENGGFDNLTVVLAETN